MAQPNMGQRKLYATRPPKDVARAFEQEIAQSGLTCSQLLADMVAARYGLQLPSERFRTKSARVSATQGTLALGKSGRRRVKPAAPRDVYTSRFPQDVAVAFEREAAVEYSDSSYSQFLADLLADRYGLPLSSTRSTHVRENHSREVLRLDQAS